MKVVELFCGCGGFALGAHWAGFDVISAFDIDPTLTSSFSTNFPETKLALRDVSLLQGEDVLGTLGQRSRDFGIIGGPPCQGFSDIGHRRIRDPRRSLVRHFFRVVQEAQPTFFVMENVRGLGYASSSALLKSALAQVARDYNTLGPVTLDASDFGAATRRKRLFFIGIHKREGSAISESLILQGMRPTVSVRSAIGDLQRAQFIEEDAAGFDHWRVRPSGRPSNYARASWTNDRTVTSHRKIAHADNVRLRFESLAPGETDIIGRHVRLTWEGFCPTLRAGTGPDHGSRQAVRPIHPEEARVITVREAARLQGFPDSHIFHPTVWHSFRMIGNSVSPQVGAAVLRAVSQHLKI